MSKRWAIRNAELALACLLTTACAASQVGSTNIVEDKEGLALNQQRLSVAVEDLNAVTDPSHAQAEGPARPIGCSIDSGQVFEPSASRSWTLTGPARDDTDPESVDAEPLKTTPAGQQAMERIAAQLIARGWSGSAQVQHTAEDVYVIDLQRIDRDHRVSLGLQGFNDSILAVATTTPKHVFLCRCARVYGRALRAAIHIQRRGRVLRVWRVGTLPPDHRHQ
jgi:hypothetical protein